jgi:diketogulonate reductase-like aldo/keto reductase
VLKVFPTLPEVMLPNAEEWPVLGLGTAGFGHTKARAATELAALREAFDLGYRVVDTAEMDGGGTAEVLVGKALREAMAGGLRREEICIVSKVLPQNASPAKMLQACEASLQRLGVDRLDLYLLHWRGPIPLKESVAAFELLQQRRLIRNWGVSNFDLHDMRELVATPGGAACSVNQVWYSLSQRGVEHKLQAWMRLYQMPLMAYCPLDRGELLQRSELLSMARQLEIEPAQLALSWLVSQPNVLALPKAVRALHLRQNLEAAHWRLGADELAKLDLLFPAPPTPTPLAMR